MSPVIGVVMIVAITVILAGIVGATVMGMGGNVQEHVRAGVDVEFDEMNDEVDVTYVTTQNAAHLNVTLSTGSAEAKAVLRGSGARVRARGGSDLSVVGDAEIPNGCNWHEKAASGAGSGGAGSGGSGGSGGGSGSGTGGAPTIVPPMPLSLSWGGEALGDGLAGIGAGKEGPPDTPALRGCTPNPPGKPASYAPEDGDRIDVVVTGVKGDSRTVIVSRTGTI